MFARGFFSKNTHYVQFADLGGNMPSKNLGRVSIVPEVEMD